MSTEGLRKCCHCGAWYRPHPRNEHHQRFCSQPECQSASKRASQRKWCRKNPGYFHGDLHVKKVQAWRREHPGYWKRKGAAENREPPDALQDVLNVKVPANIDVSAFRNSLFDEISRPLQDVLMAQQHTLAGLAAMISGDALQEDIARVLTACYERGQRIGGIVPWMQPQEVKHART